MASIFEGVPFIMALPGQREPINHAANLAVGAQIGATMSRERIANRDMDMREKMDEVMRNQENAKTSLLQSRLAFAADETSDHGLMVEWLPKLYNDPDQVETPPFRTMNALEEFEKRRALVEQRKLGISRVQIAQGIEKRIHTLPGHAAGPLISQLMKSGINDELVSRLTEAETSHGLIQGLTPSANTAIYAEKLKMQADQVRSADPAAADRLQRTADQITTTTDTSKLNEKARLDVAKQEFQATVKDLDPTDPAWTEARNRYLRTVNEAGGGSSGAANLLNSMGISQDDFQQTLKRAAEAWKQQQGP